MHLMEYSPQASRESSSSSPPLAAAAAAAVGVPPWEDGARCSCPLPLLPNSARVALGVPAAVMRRGTPTVTASCAAADSSRSRAAAMNLQRRGQTAGVRLVQSAYTCRFDRQLFTVKPFICLLVLSNSPQVKPPPRTCFSAG